MSFTFLVYKPGVLPYFGFTRALAILGLCALVFALLSFANIGTTPALVAMGVISVLYIRILVNSAEDMKLYARMKDSVHFAYELTQGQPELTKELFSAFHQANFVPALLRRNLTQVSTSKTKELIAVIRYEETCKVARLRAALQVASLIHAEVSVGEFSHEPGRMSITLRGALPPIAYWTLAAAGLVSYGGFIDPRKIILNDENEQMLIDLMFGEGVYPMIGTDHPRENSPIVPAGTSFQPDTSREIGLINFCDGIKESFKRYQLISYSLPDGKPNIIIMKEDDGSISLLRKIGENSYEPTGVTYKTIEAFAKVYYSVIREHN